MKVIVIGAGLAGLGAGLELKKLGIDFRILESSASPGGLAKTDNMEGFPFDYTGHYLHIKTEQAFKELIEQTIPFIKIKRESAVLIEKKIVPYPVQYNLKHLGSGILDRIISEIAALQNSAKKSPECLTQFIKGHFGETLLQLFFKPYNEKLWGRSLSELPKDCLGNYFPKIDLSMLLDGCNADTVYNGYNNYFYYPVSGKIGSLPDSLAEKLTENIVYNKKIDRIDLVNKICHDTDGFEYAYDHLISSMPLPELSAAIGNEAIDFKYTAIKNTRLIIKGKLLHHYNWLYVPDENVPFYRIGFPQTVSPEASPDGYVSISVESEIHSCGSYTDQQIAELTVNYLVSCNLISFEQFRLISNATIAPAYTYCLPAQAGQIDALFKKLKDHEVTPVGRYGLWKYFSMEEAYLSGKEAAAALKKVEQFSTELN